MWECGVGESFLPIRTYLCSNLLTLTYEFFIHVGKSRAYKI